MTESEIRDRVWAYIVDNFLYMQPDVDVDPDESLLRRQILDSLGVMEIIGLVEEMAGIKVNDEEITEANFGTLNAIARYVASKIPLAARSPT